MINKIPEKWDTSKESLETLFFFYQVAEELLDDRTPDSFALPMHNALTLVFEIQYTSHILEQYGLVEKYYDKYVPIIIDEFLEKLQNDSVLKGILGFRLESIKKGFIEAKKDSSKIKMWIESFMQACSLSEYIDGCIEAIKISIKTNKCQKVLIQYVANYFISLIGIGYSKRFLRNELIQFFGLEKIESCEQIDVFLKKVSPAPQKFEFLILVDYKFFDFLERIEFKSDFFQNIKIIDVEKQKDILEKNRDGVELLAQYRRLVAKTSERKISVVSWETTTFDAYSAVQSFNDYVDSLQTLPRFFYHNMFSKTVYRFLVKRENGSYANIRLPSILNFRATSDRDSVEQLIKNVLNSKSMSSDASSSIIQAMEMHSNALESMNVLALFRNFWTALETLFSEPNEESIRENVVFSVKRIMQKIFVLKKYRAVYSQLEKALGNACLSANGINSFHSFVQYLASYDLESSEMKNIYSLLGKNPLMRNRVYTMKKEMSESKQFIETLNEHSNRIEQHLHRLYRIRNFATHIGCEVPGIKIAINHLHNYFDYVVNYILCKSANSDFVCGVQSIVFEAKNDEAIHESLIKQYKNISSENYMAWLFGPDEKMIDYSFDCL
ncbi:hypothetical protein SAMN05720473_11337 [Fibrobacter sp. UWB15]|uniref:hypothetical protein n=1 Tax=unclassified Fibrobacter TaxID=2634177 RepID=UPI00091E5E67|nr:MULTISPECIES: hypothetical protein [unclassified Fibrobacter]PWJ61960.1 hypothetical protein BGW99_11437 [Fibrobacter sp. UWB6]SHG57272.1 hypothetical protein SAMN05720760_11518 [Fibrobacter sp. UWB8]SMG42225.1 hypothetical protein SAMN05720473_11337 [Fibrobacter sp. UWB15]